MSGERSDYGTGYQIEQIAADLGHGPLRDNPPWERHRAALAVARAYLGTDRAEATS